MGRGDVADREGGACQGIEAEERGRAGGLVELDARGRLLRAALGFLSVQPSEPELQLLHRCFDTWRGIATSSPAWRGRSTTSSSGATTAGAGARYFSRAASSTR